MVGSDLTDHAQLEALPWDLDALTGADLRRAYEGTAAFVAWLGQCDVRVPACWYAHGWVVRRLAALSYWHEAALAVDAPARDAAEWWSAGLESLCHDWTELLGHRGRHVPHDAPLADPQPVAPFDEWVASLTTVADAAQ